MTRKFLMIAAVAAVALTSSFSIRTAEARWLGYRHLGYYHTWRPAYYAYGWRGYSYRPYYYHYYGPRCYYNGRGAEVCY